MPRERQLIQSYGNGRFRIAGEIHLGSVIVLTGRCAAWPAATAADISFQSLAEVVAAGADIDILIVGCGVRFVPLPHELRRSLSAVGIVLEWMDTGAACRTFNVLVGEDRRVAAAIVAVD